MVGIAQLVRAPDCGSGCRGFESLYPPHMKAEGPGLLFRPKVFPQRHNKEDLHQLFFDLRDRLGQTFVIVTHDEGLAKITDRTVHMVDGTIKKD